MTLKVRKNQTTESVVHSTKVHSTERVVPKNQAIEEGLLELREAELEAQQAWQQYIDDDEAGLGSPPWEE